MSGPMFSDAQRAKMREPLSRKDARIKVYEGNPYLPSHEAIDTANALFGFGMWDTEVVEKILVSEQVLPTADGKKQNCVVQYLATVRVTVRDENGNACSHSDSSDGVAYQGTHLPPPHGLASQKAISTAMRRAMRKFGNAFGNSLYDKDDMEGWGAGRLQDQFGSDSQANAALPPAAPSGPEPFSSEEQARQAQQEQERREHQEQARQTQQEQARQQQEQLAAQRREQEQLEQEQRRQQASSTGAGSTNLAAPAAAVSTATSPSSVPTNGTPANMDADQVIAQLKVLRDSGKPVPDLLSRNGWTTPRLIRALNPQQLAQVGQALQAA